MSNPYRDAGDEIERTWHQRSNGIRPRHAGPWALDEDPPALLPIARPKNIWLGERDVPVAMPKPPIDAALLAQVEDAEHRRRQRARRIWKSIISGVLFVALVAAIAWGIVKWVP